jgi:hypothetical protein
MTTNTTVSNGLVRSINDGFEGIVSKNSIVSTVSDDSATIFSHFALESKFAGKGLFGIETGLEMHIADHALGINKHSATTKGFQSENAFGMTNEAKFRAREVVDGGRARAKRAIRQEKGHGHEAVDDRARRLLCPPGFTLHFAIETGSTFREWASRGITN